MSLGRGKNCPSQAPAGNFPSPGGRSDPCQRGLSLWGDVSGAPRKQGGLSGDSWCLQGGMGVLIVRTAGRSCRVTSSDSCSVFFFFSCLFFYFAASNPTSHCCPQFRHTQVLLGHPLCQAPGWALGAGHAEICEPQPLPSRSSAQTGPCGRRGCRHPQALHSHPAALLSAGLAP